MGFNEQKWIEMGTRPPKMAGDTPTLVGGLEHFLFSISYMGCHPKPIDELIFFKMVIAPPTRTKMALESELEDIQTSSHEYAESVRPMQIQ